MIYQGASTIFNQGKQEALASLIKQENEMGQMVDEGRRSFSYRIAKYLSVTKAKDVLEILNIVFSLTMAVTYVVGSYIRNNAIINIVNTVLCLYFIFDLVLNTYISENKLMFLLSTIQLLEYVTIIPQFMSYLGFISDSNLIQFTITLRYLLIFRLEKLLANRSMEIMRHIFLLVYLFTSIMLIEAAFLMLVEPERYTILEYYYFTIVTMSTVGFGDIAAKTDIGRFSVIAMIFIILAFAPGLVDGLQRQLRLKSKYLRVQYKEGEVSQDHVLILGVAKSECVQAFLSEFYHADHGVIETFSIIMQTTPPNEELQYILSQPSLAYKIIYLQGSALNKHDLRRSNVERAKCVVIISSKQSQNDEFEDHRNIIYAVAVKKYVYAMLQREIRVCLQLIRPSNKDLYSRLYASLMDQVICIEELKLFLLAKTCLCPGITTIVSFLLTSNKPDYDVTQYDSTNAAWMDDYLFGMQMEIYRVPLEKDIFLGISFSLVASHFYKYLGYIMFALEVTVAGQISVFVNPADYVFNDQKHYCYLLSDKLPDVTQFSNTALFKDIPRNYAFEPINNHQQYNKQSQNQNQNKKQQGTHNKLQKLQKTHFLQLNFEDEQMNAQINKEFYYAKAGKALVANMDGAFQQELFENHIIICGLTPNIKHILLPLRSKTLQYVHPVIIMHTEMIGADIWRKVNRFPKVYFFQGDPLKIQDLERAQIGKALAVIILQKFKLNNNNTANKADQPSSSYQEAAQEEYDLNQQKEEDIIDADTIFIYKIIKLAAPQIRIITELAQIQTISFLSMTKNVHVQKLGHIMSEPFASGEVYISTMLDTLLGQAYYNPFIANILWQLLMGNSSLTSKARKRNQEHKLECSNLFLVYLPYKFHGKPFGELFEHLCLERKMIPIGIYRGAKSKKNARPYVFLCPVASVILTQKDMIYVLSPKQPKEFDPNIMEDERRKNLYKDGDQMEFTIKSKLRGAESKNDMDQAIELNKINIQMKKLANELKSLNVKQFAKGFSDESFIPDVRKILRKELGKS